MIAEVIDPTIGGAQLDVVDRPFVDGPSTGWGNGSPGVLWVELQTTPAPGRHHGAHTPSGRTGRTVLRVDAGPGPYGRVLKAAEIHVDGRVAQGRLSAFSQGLERYLAYASDHGYALPRVLQGLSGPMKSIRLVYTYDDLAAYENHEARTLHDAGYAETASAMEFFEGTITYSLFRTVQ
ncbi:MAG TPA: hypothetical protein VFN61_12265 [Acidimicrobiales bacterium]|nr:hypothetical protein [Acidimicrobiales bacterium]